MIMKRNFPFTDVERAFVLSAIEVAIQILKAQGHNTGDAEALREELANEETIEKLRQWDEEIANNVWEMAGENVVDLSAYRKPTYRNHQDEIDAALEDIASIIDDVDARNSVCEHEFVAIDRHGDELICEKCGAWKED